MPVDLNHTIVACRDKEVSAAFMTEILGIKRDPTPFGPFLGVETDNGVTIDFIDAGPDYEIESRHFAFIVSEAEFDEIFGRIQERGLTFRGDPHGGMVGEINHHFGGRGVYWEDPDGHLLEIITQPYSNE